ncbi:hypothetical protein SAMN03159353_100295 [Cedecea sp. NFIX57]|nr:hypothetical protein SAMN03159353_100295 [Cedecea sp. NFIX57]
MQSRGVNADQPDMPLGLKESYQASSASERGGWGRWNAITLRSIVNPSPQGFKRVLRFQALAPLIHNLLAVFFAERALLCFQQNIQHTLRRTAKSRPPLSHYNRSVN